jgi:hypothetical protein
MGARRGVVYTWRPQVALQMWARNPCPPCGRKIRQPGVRPPPPVSTKRELSGKHSHAAPSLCQQRAQERAWCPSKVALHSPRVVTWCATRESSLPPPGAEGVASQGLARCNSREGTGGDAAWLTAPFGTCGTPTIRFQCMSIFAPHATPPAPRPGSARSRRASGAHVGARNANLPISAGTVGTRARNLDCAAERARTVSMRNRRPSHRPARAVEGAAMARDEEVALEQESLLNSSKFGRFGDSSRLRDLYPLGSRTPDFIILLHPDR